MATTVITDFSPIESRIITDFTPLMEGGITTDFSPLSPMTSTMLGLQKQKGISTLARPNVNMEGWEEGVKKPLSPKELVLGTLETIPTLASAIATFIPKIGEGGFQIVADIIKDGKINWDKVEQAQERIPTYIPKTEWGSFLSQIIALPYSYPREAVTSLGTTPEQQKGLGFLYDAVMAGSMVKGAVAKGKEIFKGIEKEKVPEPEKVVTDFKPIEEVPVEVVSKKEVPKLGLATESKEQLYEYKLSTGQKVVTGEKSIKDVIEGYKEAPTEAKPVEPIPEVKPEEIKAEIPTGKGVEVKEPWQMTLKELRRSDELSSKRTELYPDIYFRGERIVKSGETKYNQADWNDVANWHKKKVQQALSEDKPVPLEVLKDYPELAGKVIEGFTPIEEGKLTPTILQNSKEYKDLLGESGYVRIGGEEVTPKVVTPDTKDVSLLEFPLGTLHVADRNPVLAPIIKANIKAEQSTNHWILRYSDRIGNAFDKVEKPSIWMKMFGRKGTDIRDVDLMIEGKKPIPQELTGFVSEVKGILGDVKTEIITKMKNDFAESLTPKQREYLTYLQKGGSSIKPDIADKTLVKMGLIETSSYPKHIRKTTIEAVNEAQKQFKEMENWGIQDYFPHIFKGRFKYLTEDGHIISSGTTAKQAKANFEEYISSHPEEAKKTFMFVNDFYDLTTVRKSLNPELVNPLEYLGTRLSRKEFFRLLNKTEKTIKEEITNAGVSDVSGVKVDMSGIASFQKGKKFSGHFMERKTSLRGEQIDPFRAMVSYIFSVGRKLGLEDAKMASYAFADSLPVNMPNAKSYIKMQADNMAGRYNLIDKIFDETIGAKLGLKSFATTRAIGKAVGLESKLKLGYAPAKTAINRIGGVFHIILQEGVKNYIEGKKLLIKKDPELIGRIQREGHLAGMEQLFAGEGLVGVSEQQTALWRPLGGYQKAEVRNRSEALASAYVAGMKKFKGDKDAAWIYALDSATLTQGLYNIAAKPVIVRNPVVSASYQFKQYLTNEIRFMSQLTPKQWTGYVAGITALSGTKGALLTLKSIIGISIVGIGIDEIMERLNRKAPHLHRGVFGLVGFDVSAPASWQIPSQLTDWLGAFPKDVINTGTMIVKGLKNNGWTDEDISNYIKQLAPVGYNIFKGLQMLSEGTIKEGSKVIYRGDKTEGVINLTGAKSVSQSQASDSARYMNQQKQLLMDKIKVVEDRLFGSKSNKEAEQNFKNLVELKNIQTPEELQTLIEGLRQSAKSRQLTQEIRTFMSLPRSLKKEEIKRRQ